MPNGLIHHPVVLRLPDGRLVWMLDGDWRVLEDGTWVESSIKSADIIHADWLHLSEVKALGLAGVEPPPTRAARER